MADRPIRPYAVDDYPDLFEKPDCTITVLSARRTVWKKTAAKKSPTPQYFGTMRTSRCCSTPRTERRPPLLERVAKHKAVFFRSAWANSDTARPGTLRLMPSAERLQDLRADDRDKAPMLFDDKPLSFDEIPVWMQTLQGTISLRSRGLR